MEFNIYDADTERRKRKLQKQTYMLRKYWVQVDELSLKGCK